MSATFSRPSWDSAKPRGADRTTWYASANTAQDSQRSVVARARLVTSTVDGSPVTNTAWNAMATLRQPVQSCADAKARLVLPASSPPKGATRTAARAAVGCSAVVTTLTTLLAPLALATPGVTPSVIEVASMRVPTRRSG